MFLPDDYEAPKSTNQGYMKLQDGENRIRILSQPIFGWEDWTADKKPVRFRYNNKPEKPLVANAPIRHFWAMIVWNYAEEKIQVLHITQASIRKTLMQLIKDADWGTPYNYDIKVVKQGKQKETEYSVNPVPGKPVSQHIIEEFKQNPCNLEALFDNADPYAKEWREYTALMSDVKPVSNVVPIISKVTLDEANELSCLLDCCDPAYKESVWTSLQKNGIASLHDLSRDMFDRVKKAAIKKSEEYKNQDLPF